MRERVQAVVRVARAGAPRARREVLRDGTAAARAAALAAGMSTGVLPCLERRPLTLDALAAGVGASDAGLLEALLRVLAAHRLVRSMQDRWGITPTARDVLADPVARAAATAFDVRTEVYRGLADRLAGRPPRRDVEPAPASLARLPEAFEPSVLAHVRAVTQRLAPRRVLDVGCGSGAFLQAALEAAPEATGLGIDADPDAVALARHTLETTGLGARATVRQAEVADLATAPTDEDAPADLLLLTDALVRVPPAERVALLRLLAGLVRPGGALLVVTATPEDHVLSRHTDLVLRAQGRGLSLPTARDLAAQLGQAGWGHVETCRLAPASPLHALTAAPTGGSAPPATPPEEATGMAADLHLTGDDDADALLSTEPLALLIGMLLDQQVPMETAFAGPARLRERLGGLDAGTIARMDPDELDEVCRRAPAVHRYPGAMATRIRALCAEVVNTYGGEASAIWTGEDLDGRTVLRRLKALPGFGDQKSRVFLALLGKQLGLQAPGWREAAGPYGEAGVHRSVADVVDPESLARVRETKRAARAAARAAAGA